MAKQKENKLDIIRHSLSHLMAIAVLEIYPKAKIGIGPTIENGFYYDFDAKIPEEDLSKIEKRMKELIKKDLSFKKEIISFSEAKKIFADQPYKLELIKELNKAKQKISIYKTQPENLKANSSQLKANFIDLCAGPHVKNTKEINPDAFKITKIAGAYWRGDEKNKMLTRIYGIAFNTKKELEEYLKMMEEAEKRDHKKIGRELNLFSFHEEAPGFAFWHPKGMILRENLMNFHSYLHKQDGYQAVSTPILLSEELWHQSGHWDHYKNNMYFTKIDNRTFAVKPMNCPGVILIYKNQMHSYRELPLMFSELGEVHRHEPSGTLNGLFRVRAFRQDDAHIFATEDQIENEIKKICKLIFNFYDILGFCDVEIELSTRPKESMGTAEMWRKAESILKNTLKNSNIKFKVNPGDGAFYGPKIDFHIKDSLNRSWQCGTIQIDFQMPERFDLTYIDKNGKPKRPIMIHRTVMGSIQRFLGILIEHFAGAFPLWLSPVQAKVLAISEKQKDYAEKLLKELKNNNIRVEMADVNETLGKRIREAEMEKIPYILVVGDKEKQNNTVSVRHYRRGQEPEIKIEKLIEKIKSEIENKVI